MQERTRLRYEGKAKRVHDTPNPDAVLIEFTDAATAFNGEKRAELAGKGAVNAAVTERLCRLLDEAGVATHFLERVDERRILARAVEIIPLEVVVRNRAAGSFSRRLGVPEGTQLARPIVEFSYKRDDLGDPLVTRSHAEVLGLATPELLDELEARALRVNELLRTELEQREIDLVDFKLEFGRTADGTLLLADEISPDTCRFWDAETGERLDKDRFRHDLGNTEAAYAELLERLGGDPLREEALA